MGKKDFSTWFLTGAVTVLFVILGYFGDKSLDELRSIRGELTDIKVNIATVTGNQNNLQIQINSLDKRVDKLEGKP